MFNSKRIKEIEDRVYRLENPFKFKVGDWIKSKNNDLFGIIINLDFDANDDRYPHSYTVYTPSENSVCRTYGQEHLELIEVELIPEFNQPT